MASLHSNDDYDAPQPMDPEEVEESLLVPNGYLKIGSTSNTPHNQPFVFIDLHLSRSADKQLQIFEKGVKLTILEKYDVIWLKWGEGDFPEPNHSEDLDDYYSFRFQISSNASFRLNVEIQIDLSHLPPIHGNSPRCG